MLTTSVNAYNLLSYRGRSDLEVFTGRNIYIFEFKYNKSLQEAMDQIRDRDYAGLEEIFVKI